jgi:hypothetical protein
LTIPGFPTAAHQLKLRQLQRHPLQLYRPTRSSGSLLTVASHALIPMLVLSIVLCIEYWDSIDDNDMN